MPMPLPITVKIVLPVDTKLTDRLPDTHIVSTDAADVRLPPIAPEVAVSRRLCPTPMLCRPFNDVSDIQELVSHPDTPTLRDPDTEPIPRPEPLTRTKLEPVDARLRRVVLDKAARSIDRASLIVPLTSPPVTIILFVITVVAASKQCNDVSDSHKLASHPVDPALAESVDCLCPSPAPSILSATLPVVAPLLLRRADTPAASIDIASLTLPTCSPAVSITRMLLPCPKVSLPTNDVSDTHTVLSKALPAILAAVVYTAEPMLCPEIVKGIAPDDARFCTPTLDSVPWP